MGTHYTEYISDRKDSSEDCYDWPITGIPGDQLVEGGLDSTPDADYAQERWMRSDVPDVWVSNMERIYNLNKNEFVKPVPDKSGHLHIKVDNVTPMHFQPSVHREFAKAFIPNPRNEPIVRHLDDNPDNNDLRNLAWGTRRENYFDSIINGTGYEFTEEDHELSNEATRHPIVAINQKTGEQLYFKSQREAGRQLNVSQGNIAQIIDGSYARHSAAGYVFEEIDKENEHLYM